MFRCVNIYLTYFVFFLMCDAHTRIFIHKNVLEFLRQVAVTGICIARPKAHTGASSRHCRSFDLTHPKRQYQNARTTSPIPCQRSPLVAIHSRRARRRLSTACFTNALAATCRHNIKHKYSRRFSRIYFCEVSVSSLLLSLGSQWLLLYSITKHGKDFIDIFKSDRRIHCDEDEDSSERRRPR